MAKKIGKRAKVKIAIKRETTVKPAAKAQGKLVVKQYALNELVGFMLDDERLVGTVMEFVGHDYRVVTESGRRFVCTPDELKTPLCSVEGCGGEATGIDALCDDCRKHHVEDEDNEDDSVDIDLVVRRRRQKDPKLNYAGVLWDDVTVNFQIKELNGVRFYGWWRKTKEGDGSTVFSMDIFAERDGKSYTLDTIGYRGVDPRENLKSLNADISAACQRWMFHNFSDNAESIDAMRRKAEKPTVMINRIGTIDRLIMQLKEFRDVAIRCGGTRHFELNSDKAGFVPVLITINVTQQAIALDGKPPTLHMGSMMDAAIETRGKSKLTPGSITQFKADPKNVEQLQKALLAAKAAGNEQEQRKIRATLRQIGVKGGARSLIAAGK